MSPRSLFLALAGTALAPVLWAGSALSRGPSAAGPGEAAGGGPALALTSLAALSLFLAFRRSTGRDGPALAAACSLACFPSLPDALSTSRALPLLAAVFAASLLLLILSSPAGAARPGDGRLRLAAAALPAPGVLLLSSPLGVEALFPRGLLLAPLGAFLVGETARRIGEAGGAERLRRALVLLLGLVLAAGAGAGALRARSWEDPVAFWERAAARSPSSPVVLGALAGARQGAGDGPGAEAALRRFVEEARAGSGTGLPEAGLRRGAEGAVRAALPLLAAGGGGTEAASAALEAASELSPGSPLVLRGKGERLLARGDFTEAIQVLQDSVSREPGAAGAWDALARALLPAARLPEALGASQRATGLDPANPAFARTYAETLLAAGRGGDALTVLKESLGTPPYDPVQARAFSEAERRLAKEERSAGRPGRARRLLAAALQVDPGNAACREMKDDLDRGFEAERPEFERLMEPGPDGTTAPDNILLYAAWLCRWGEFEKARPLFRLLLEQRSGTAAVHFQAGNVFWEEQGTLEGYGEAVRCYRDALARDPGYAEARNRLWRALRALGRIPEAREEARRFLDAAPAHPDSFEAEQFLGGRDGGR